MEDEMDLEVQSGGRVPFLAAADLEAEGLVPMAVLETIADAHAHCVWGQEVGRGQPFPVVDAAGKLAAYVFPFVRGSRDVPAYEAIFEAVARARAVEGGEAEGESLEQITARYGSIYVSATRHDFPVLRVEHFLHPFFLTGEGAQMRAR